jgi:hypothetical protein
MAAMAKGFDTSTPLSAAKAQQFATDGYDFVIRYLAPESWHSWKALTRAEAEAITAAGMMIVSVWETTAGAAGEGAAAGREAGIFAFQAAKEVGQPEGTKIYFCVDFEPMPHQYAMIADYFRAADAEIPGYEIDAYGNDKIIEYLQAQGIIRNGFQTIAWSGGRLAAGISIHQHDCGPNGLGFPLHGILIDADESFGNEGWWNTNMAIISQLPPADFDQEAAQKVIADLGALYEASDNEAVMKAAHYAAEALRVATGIKE